MSENILPWGIGRPDGTQLGRPTKPIAGTDQLATTYYTEVTLDAGTNTTITLFTIPAGKTFILSSAIICTDASCIQKFEYRPLGYLFLTCTYDTNFNFVDSDIGAAVFVEDWYLDIKLYNNDEVERTIYVCLWGNYYDS